MLIDSGIARLVQVDLGVFHPAFRLFLPQSLIRPHRARTRTRAKRFLLSADFKQSKKLSRWQNGHPLSPTINSCPQSTGPAADSPHPQARASRSRPRPEDGMELVSPTNCPQPCGRAPTTNLKGVSTSASSSVVHIVDVDDWFITSGGFYVRYQRPRLGAATGRLGASPCVQYKVTMLWFRRRSTAIGDTSKASLTV